MNDPKVSDQVAYVVGIEVAKIVTKYGIDLQDMRKEIKKLKQEKSRHLKELRRYFNPEQKWNEDIGNKLPSRIKKLCDFAKKRCKRKNGKQCEKCRACRTQCDVIKIHQITMKLVKELDIE